MKILMLCLVGAILLYAAFITIGFLAIMFIFLFSDLSADTKSWLKIIAAAVFIVGLALVALIGGGYCNYAKLFDKSACHISWISR